MNRRRLLHLLGVTAVAGTGASVLLALHNVVGSGEKMQNKPPKIIAIEPDDYHAKHVGKTSDGRQFFLTTPFEPSSEKTTGCEYLALYLFDKNGELLSATIDSFGPRPSLNDDNRRRLYEVRLQDLGKVSLERIEIAPFSVKRFGTEFGLVLRQPEDEDEDVWAVEAQPGNYMAFFEPWDSGEYDT